MLVIPVTSTSGKKKLPYTTLLLILINCFVYFFIQSGDNEASFNAYSFYEDSGLIETELVAYLDYLKYSEEQISEVLNQPEERHVFSSKMLQDDMFQHKISQEEIILPASPEYATWRKNRTEFENLLSQSVTQHYGYSPVNKNYPALFTYMFLHGGIMHLVGNMVFLWLVGGLLELAVAPVLFLAGYLVTGICASLLFGLAYPLAAGPLVGASGAIAGLMGGYAIFFWRQRIRIFYSLGFYFDYAKVPALALLPFWLVNEIVQLTMNQDNHVAYMAHIGGLLSGSGLATVHLFTRGNRADELFEEDEQKKRLEELLERGQKKLADLDLKGARKDMETVLELEPNNPLAVRNLYTIDKVAPQSEFYHQSASRLLTYLARGNEEDFLSLFEEYKQLSGKPKINTKIISRLVLIYLKKKRLPEASGCLLALMKRVPTHPDIPNNLIRLAHAYLASHQKDNARKCLDILARKYGETSEGIEAQEILLKHQN